MDPKGVADYMNIQELIQKIMTGSPCCGIRLQGADFSHLNLAGANFKDSDLSRSKFCFANLSGSAFQGCDLRESDFPIVLSPVLP